MPPLEPFRPSPSDADFEGADLRYHHFLGLRADEGARAFSFLRATLKGSRFEDSVLRGADFSHSDFGTCDVRRTRFVACTFRYFEMANCRLEEARFEGGDASGGSILDCVLERCTFTDGDWTGSNVHRNVFEECVFEGTRFPRASIENNHFHKCTFRDVDLADQTFVWSVLDGCRFEGVRLGLEVLTTCSGLTLRDLRDVTVVHEGEEIAAEDVPPLLEMIYENQLEVGELTLAANVAALLGRRDLLERALEAVAPTLAAGAGMQGVYWTRLCRKLLHWNATGVVETYWTLWTFRALVDHLKRVRAGGGLPDYHLMEAVTLLIGPVQAEQEALARRAVASIRGVPLSGRVDVAVRVDDALPPEAVLRMLEELGEEVAPQLPPGFTDPAALMRMDYRSHRFGSIEIMGTMIALGSFVLQFLQWQAMKGAPAAAAPGAEDASPSRTPSPEGAVEPLPAPLSLPSPGTVASAPVALAPTDAAALQAAAEETFAVNLAMSIVLPPQWRARLVRMGFSFSIKR